MMTTALLDFVMVILLAMVIVYIINLNRRLMIMRSQYEDLKTLSQTFTESLGKAQFDINHLEEAAFKVEETLSHQISKAFTLKEDLEFIADRADALATRLEDAIRVGRPRAQEYVHDELKSSMVQKITPKTSFSEQKSPESLTEEETILMSRTYAEDLITADSPDQAEMLKTLSSMR